VQWVENEDWVYKTTFNVTDEQLSRDAALLILEGLDTYADIYLNGSLLERTDNMFVGYTLPVKEVLRKGENHLQILSSKLYPNGKPMVLIILLIMIIVISGLVSIAVKRLTVMAGIGESAW
jgi:beta-galactosidase/beta-glucuronidase